MCLYAVPPSICIHDSKIAINAILYVRLLETRTLVGCWFDHERDRVAALSTKRLDLAPITYCRFRVTKGISNNEVAIKSPRARKLDTTLKPAPSQTWRIQRGQRAQQPTRFCSYSSKFSSRLKNCVASDQVLALTPIVPGGSMLARLLLND